MTSPHPLDPLSADELRRVAAVLRRERDLRPSWRFASIELQEPDKRRRGTSRRPGGRW